MKQFLFYLKRKINTTHLEVIIIFLLCLTPLLWLKGEEVILGHDSGFRLLSTPHLKSLFYSWNPTVDFGVDWSIFKGFLVAQLPENLFTVLTGSLHWGQLLTFIFWFFAMAMSMYILVNGLFPQKRYWVFRTFSSIFYAYNFYILQAWFIAERGKFSLYTALPLGFLIIYKLFSKDLALLKGAILFSVLFFVFNGGGSLPLYGGIILTYSLLFLYLAIFEISKKGAKGIFFSLKTLIALLVTTLLLNAYWVVPQINLYLRNFEQALQASGGIVGVLNWEKTVSGYASLINLFRLQGIPDWFGGTHPYSGFFLKSPLLIIGSFVPFLIILVGVWLKDRLVDGSRETKLRHLFFLVFLVGALFTAGSRSPFGSIYGFLAENLPGFVIFRSSFYKFATAFWFSFVFLSGYFLNKLLLRYTKGRVFTILGGIFVLFLLFYHFPYFSGNFFAWNEPFSTKVDVPEYVNETLNFMDMNLSENSKVLLLPRLDRNFKVDSYSWGYFSLDLLPKLGTERSIVADDTSATRAINELYTYLEQGEVDKFLELSRRLGINSFLWRDDVLYSDKTTTSQNLDYMQKSLSSTKTINKVFESGNWSLYVLEDDVRPLIGSAPGIVRADPGTGGLVEVRAIMDGLALPVLYTDKVGGIPNKGELFAGDIVLARCSLCRPAEFEELVSTVDFGTSILPDSHLYPLILYKEERLFEKYQNIPTQRVDVKLALANRRLSEIFGLVSKKEKKDYSELISGSIEMYSWSMEDAISQLDLMSEIDSNYYTVKISAYLEAQSRFLEGLDSKEGIFGQEMYDSLADFVRERKNRLLGKAWQTEFPLVQRYFVTIRDVGEYKILFYPETPPLEEVRVDEEVVEGKILLDSGTHKLEVVYPEPENLLPLTGDGETRTLNPISGQPEKYVLDLKTNHTYLVKFRYRFDSGGRPEFWLDGAGDIVKRKLDADGKWHDFGVIFSSSNKEPVVFSFRVPGVNRVSSIEIGDFGLYEYYVPSVLLVSETENLLPPSPKVEYQKLSPTLYEVGASGSETPYILMLSEKFDSGWRLLSKNQSMLENIQGLDLVASHVEVDGYANGWVIDAGEPLEARLIYWPQIWFYVGLGISGATVLGFVILLLSKKI